MKIIRSKYFSLSEQNKVDRYSERAVVYTAPFGLAELIPNDLMQIIWNLK